MNEPSQVPNLIPIFRYSLQLLFDSCRSIDRGTVRLGGILGGNFLQDSQHFLPGFNSYPIYIRGS